MRQELLRQHVARVRGIDLAVDRHRARSRHFSHRHGARGSFTVVQEASSLETGLEVAGRQRRRVAVCAVREACPIPLRHREGEDDGDDACQRDCRAPSCRTTGLPRHTDAHHNRHQRGQSHRHLEADSRNQDEARGDGPDDRADGVGGVDACDAARRRVGLEAGRRDRERERGAERDGHRQLHAPRPARPAAPGQSRTWCPVR